MAAEALQRESRTLVLRGIEQLLRTEQYRGHFEGLTPELVANLRLLLGAIIEGLQRDLSPDKVFVAHAVQRTIREHLRLRKRQGIELGAVVRESQIGKALQGLVDPSFSTGGALVVIEKVRDFFNSLALIMIAQYGRV